METKQKRTKVKVILSIILPVLLVVGTLAVSGHAKKPHPPHPEQVSVSGAIVGTGDPSLMGIVFVDTFGDDVGPQVSNPDGPLAVYGTRKGPRTLRYYYCNAPSHGNPDQCDNPDEHDPSNYKALFIYGGTLEGKAHDTQIVFPVGSIWEVRSKVLMGVEFSDILENEVTYRILN